MARGTVATIEQKIQDTTYRIGRLARYCERLQEVKPTGIMSSLEFNQTFGTPPSVVKYSGLYYLVLNAAGRILISDPRIPQVRYWFELDGDILAAEAALQDLLSFEETLTVVAMGRARQEAIETMARRIVARVTKPKTRGFKADMKRREKKPRVQAE